MENLIGMIHSQNDGDYKLVSVIPFGDELANMKRVAEETGKYPAYFYFRKILKSGKESKQGFCALMFKESKKIIKL
jgi:hypothetical protein